MKTLLIAITFALSSIGAMAQQQEIINCFKTNNAECLSAYLGDNVDLTVGNTEGVYSKAQAKVILQKFINDNAVKEFKIVHATGNESAKNLIAQMQSASKSYRVYFLMKQINSKPIIQKIRIEND
ncbi:MAG: DUF4783 domain-containing protein [Bacteroidales bacterium]|jgi:hypothetical protein|nr:DUF4783 domain-containing protein [Bacteroidales bacterium]